MFRWTHSPTAFPINDVGHAERWETIEVDGSLEQHDGMVRYRDASMSRDREIVEAGAGHGT